MRQRKLLGLGLSIVLGGMGAGIGCAEGSVAPYEEQPLQPASIAAPAQPSGSLCGELAPAVRKCGGKLTLGECTELMDRYKDAVVDAVRVCAKKPCGSMRTCLDDAIGETFEIPVPDGGTSPPRSDAGTRPDTGTPVACQPTLTGFTPGAYKAPRRQVGACTAQMATDFEDCMNGNSIKCQLFQTNPQYQACETCAVSNDTDPTWGPVVVDTVRGFATPNLGGCYGLSLGEGASPTGCGAAMQTLDECTEAACSRCPLGNPPTMAEMNAFDACMSTAASTACGAYSATAGSRCTFDGGSPPSACSGSTAAALILVFCGP